MCREMSQYMPKTAVISDTDARAEGRATQPGRPEIPLGHVGAPAEQLHTPVAVPDAEHEQAQREDHRGGADADYLVGGGAAGRLGGPGDGEQ